MIELIPRERAVYISELNAIVIADLHIGYEASLRKKEGINLPDGVPNMIERIKKLVNEYKADRLIILGDVKHSIGECFRVRDLDELPVEIMVAKGNHDGNIETLLNAKIFPAMGFVLENYGFVHGHSWPGDDVMHAKYIFMGHLHPEIEMRDSVGKIHRYPCHLVGSLTKKGWEKYRTNPRIFVIASFNPMVGSSLADPPGPLMKNKIIGNFEVYLINGAYLGKLDDILY